MINGSVAAYHLLLAIMIALAGVSSITCLLLAHQDKKKQSLTRFQSRLMVSSLVILVVLVFGFIGLESRAQMEVSRERAQETISDVNERYGTDYVQVPSNAHLASLSSREGIELLVGGDLRQCRTQRTNAGSSVLMCEDERGIFVEVLP